MSNVLILNQNRTDVGLVTNTYTIPTGGAGLYNVKMQVTVPEAVATGSGSGSGQGLGSGAGGGDAAGFARGGLGLGDGGVGQSLGNNSGYQQPPVSGSNQTSVVGITSGLSIQVKKNGTAFYTAPVLGEVQNAQQFKVAFLVADADVISVVLSSSVAADKQLNSIQSNMSIGQGVA